MYKIFSEYWYISKISIIGRKLFGCTATKCVNFNQTSQAFPTKLCIIVRGRQFLQFHSKIVFLSATLDMLLKFDPPCEVLSVFHFIPFPFSNDSKKHMQRNWQKEWLQINKNKLLFPPIRLLSLKWNRSGIEKCKMNPM